MKVELNKEDLVNLVCGVSPDFELFDHPSIKICGSYYASFGVWEWNRDNLRDYTEKELYNIYLLITK